MIAARSSSALLVVLVFATTILIICWNHNNNNNNKSSKELHQPSMTVVVSQQGKLEKRQRRLLLQNDKTGSSSDGLDMLRLQFQAAREQFIHQLNVDYGAENVQNMFFFTEESENGAAEKTTYSIGRTIYQSPSGPEGPSWNRMMRKVAKKILQSHLLDRRDNNGTTKKQHTSSSNFVWASGGHSAAAGHGNFFNESYTAVLGRNARHLFAAVGLRFEARNMAMGGTPSGHEIASCTKEVFGADVVCLCSLHRLCSKIVCARGIDYSPAALFFRVLIFFLFLFSSLLLVLVIWL
jgi:hypothetical protein